MANYTSRYTGAEIDDTISRAKQGGIIDTLLAGKQGTLTFDETPTAGSDNPVKSKGIYAGLNNLKATTRAYTLTSAGWANGVYDLTGDYPSTTYDIEVALSENTTPEQLKAFGDAGIVGSTTENKLKALNGAPTVDINIMIKAVKK